jgi:hypothetical protein
MNTGAQYHSTRVRSPFQIDHDASYLVGGGTLGPRGGGGISWLGQSLDGITLIFRRFWVAVGGHQERLSAGRLNAFG